MGLLLIIKSSKFSGSISKFLPDKFVFDRFKYLMFFNSFNFDILTLDRSIFDKSSLWIFSDIFKSRLSFFELKEFPKYERYNKFKNSFTFLCSN